MTGRNVISQIRDNLDEYVGKQILIKANKGRKRVVERRGILEKTYPSIFVVRLDEEKFLGRRVSYSYTDILTRTVELSVTGKNGEEKLATAVEAT